ncbi:unnamed protein product [Pseudo-nitzschia multistriata]|uniref:Uncharacterized protein n=1 Tax=Pseudo-nitzschia multistriata TaxID=183589 RepID=A0A448Z6A8_9STRA|nr:unnamed protein product [Pseudo-nitzschia multistriata]
MLPSFANQCSAPDDVSVPCSVRRGGESQSSEEPDEANGPQQPEEMTLTMRKWHRAPTASPEFLLRRTKSSADARDDAELILTPLRKNNLVRRGRCQSMGNGCDANTPILLSKRFASFGGPEGMYDETQEEARIERTRTEDTRGQTRAPTGPRGPIPMRHQYSDIPRQIGSEPKPAEVTIPISDIVEIWTHGEGKNATTKRKTSKNESDSREEHRRRRTIGIETCSLGSFELLMESTNELLVLQTFLKINAVQGRVDFAIRTGDDHRDMPAARGSDRASPRCSSADPRPGDRTVGRLSDGDDLNELSATIQTNPSNLTNDTAHTDGEKSIDVEAFVAKRMTERLKRESLTEKVERRMHRLVSSLEELSVSVTKCACSCFGDSSVVPMDQSYGVADKEALVSRPRRNTASTVNSEVHDEERQHVPNQRASATANAGAEKIHFDMQVESRESKDFRKKMMLKHGKMPSGLSVESEDDLEELLLFQNSGMQVLTKASI